MLKFSANKIISLFLVILIAAQIIVGGIMMPVKQANAFAFMDIIAGPVNLVKGIWEMGPKQAWEFSKAAWDKVTSGGILGATTSSAISNAYKAFMAAWNKGEAWYIKLMKITWEVLRKKLLNMLVNNIIKWIQGNGKPKFVTNWKNFINDTANEAAGKFIEGSDLGFLCSSFGTEIKIALGTAPTFKEEVSCTLDDVMKNVNDFYDDMRKGGGWDGWLKVSESQNNVFGAYWNVMGEKISRESKAKVAATNEAVSGSGFLGDKKCKKWECDEYQQADYDECMSSGFADSKTNLEDECGYAADCKCVGGYETRTPGKILADTTSKALNVDIDGIISAKEFTEYAGAIFDAVINRVAREGLSLMKTDNYKASKSNEQIRDELMQRLKKSENEIGRLANNEMNKNNRDNTIDIANRKGQRQIMLEYQKQLRDLKQNIKKAVQYLREQEKDANAMERCSSFKYDMCLVYAEDKAWSSVKEYYAPEKDACLNDNSQYCSTLENNCLDQEKSLCEGKYIECSLNEEDIEVCDLEKETCLQDASKTCVSLKNDCLQGGPQYCKDIYDEKVNGSISLVKEEFKNKCNDVPENASSDTTSLLDEKELSEEYKEYLNTSEKLRELEQIYASLPLEKFIAKEILQKLEKYKPFDECSEKICSQASDIAECQEMAWSNPNDKISFVSVKCNEEFQSKNIKEQCALQWSRQCSQDDSAAKQECEQKIQTDIQNCEQEWQNKCNTDWNEKINNSISSGGKIFGACYYQKARVVSDSFEDFSKCINDNTKDKCGINASQACKDSAYTELTAVGGVCYNSISNAPLNICIRDGRDGIPGCGDNPSAQCYNQITSSGGLCYDLKFKNITYSDLENEAKITDDDMANMQDIQENKQQEYAKITGDLQLKLKSMQKSDEECYDRQKLPDGKYNDYEMAAACIGRMMYKCAPIPPGSNPEIKKWKTKSGLWNRKTHHLYLAETNDWNSFLNKPCERISKGIYSCDYNTENWINWIETKGESPYFDIWSKYGKYAGDNPNYSRSWDALFSSVDVKAIIEESE